MKNLFFLILKVSVSFGLIIYLLSRLDLVNFVDRVETANLAIIILAGLLFYVGIYISALRWGLFLRFYNIKIRVSELCRIYLVGAFLNNFLPSSIGGDGYKFIFLSKKYLGKKKEVASSIIYDRGSGLITLVLANIILFFIFYSVLIKTELLAFLFEIFLIISIIIFIIFRKNIIYFLEKLSFKMQFINKIVSFLKVVFSFNDTKVIAKTIITSVLFLFNAAVGGWLLFLAFGIKINFLYIIFVSSFSQIVSILPISINALGVLEGVSVYLYSLIGIPIEISTAVALVIRVSMMVTSSVGGLFLFKGDKFKKENTLIKTN